MRSKAFSACLLISIFFVAPLSACGDEDVVEKKIVEISNAFFEGGVGRDEIADNLNQLLDMAVSLSASSQYHDKIKYHINVAQDLLKNDSIFNDKARQYMSFAYRMLTNGVKFKKPKELDVFVTPEEAAEKAMRYTKSLIENTLSALKEDQKEKAAAQLVAFVLMIVTPVEG